jgi:hypothetical protein
MWESQQLFFGGRLVSRIFEEFQHPAIQTKVVHHFGRFFHQIKVRQPVGRKDSMNSMKWLRTLQSFQIFEIKIKKSKTFSG